MLERIFLIAGVCLCRSWSCVSIFSDRQRYIKIHDHPVWSKTNGLHQVYNHLSTMTLLPANISDFILQVDV